MEPYRESDLLICQGYHWKDYINRVWDLGPSPISSLNGHWWEIKPLWHRPEISITDKILSILLLISVVYFLEYCVGFSVKEIYKTCQRGLSSFIQWCSEIIDYPNVFPYVSMTYHLDWISPLNWPCKILICWGIRMQALNIKKGVHLSSD